MKSNNFQTPKQSSRDATGQAIYIMWLREMKRFFRARARVIGTLAMPFFFLISFGFGMRQGFNLPGMPQMNYLNFLVPGIIGMTMLFNSIFAGISVLWDREFGFLKEILVAPVKRFAIVLGRIAGGITTALIQAILILILSLFIGFKISNHSGIILAILFMILIGIGFIGFGIAVASILENTESFSLIMQLFVFPTFLLSGAFFPVSNLPKWLKPISLINPLTYGVDGLRASLIGFSQFPLILDLTILFIFGILMVGFGSWLFNKTEI